jgi:hypothetical protein
MEILRISVKNSPVVPVSYFENEIQAALFAAAVETLLPHINIEWDVKSIPVETSATELLRRSTKGIVPDHVVEEMISEMDSVAMKEIDISGAFKKDSDE